MKRAIKHKILRSFSNVIGFRPNRFLNGSICKEKTDLSNYGFVCINDEVDSEIFGLIDSKISSRFNNLSGLNNIFLHNKGESADVPGTRSYPVEDVISELKKAREYTNFLSLKNPLQACPELLKLVTLPAVYSTISYYLGPNFALSGSNVRMSFANEFNDVETNKWHVDGNAGKLVKLFMYLNDVVEAVDGPTEYISRSHIAKFRGWDKNYRIPDQVLRQKYKPDQFVKLTGKRGQIRLADTTGIHRGLKVTSNDRTMITLNFCLHKELPRQFHRNDLMCDAKNEIVIDFITQYPLQSRFLQLA